ncbi:MAG TPA: hypothetical protein VID95_05380, partial [Candidatus Limnocylindrales bacterium]
MAALFATASIVVGACSSGATPSPSASTAASAPAQASAPAGSAAASGAASQAAGGLNITFIPKQINNPYFDAA